MPDTTANQARFPQSRTQKPGLGFPLARLVAIVSLSCGAVLDWAVGPCEGKQTGETALLWQLAKRLRPGDVVIVDRYYAGYFLIAMLVQLGVDVVIRQHQRRHTDFRRGQRLGPRDHVVIWPRLQRPGWMDQATYPELCINHLLFNFIAKVQIFRFSVDRPPTPTGGDERKSVVDTGGRRRLLGQTWPFMEKPAWKAFCWSGKVAGIPAPAAPWPGKRWADAAAPGLCTV